MLAIPNRFPIVKASSLGLGVFVVGFAGSIALLTHLHPSTYDNSGTNVATHQSPVPKVADKKKSKPTSSAESQAMLKSTPGSTFAQPSLLYGNRTALQPTTQYTAPAPSGTASGSGSLSIRKLTTAPAPLQTVTQPAPTAPSTSTSTGGTSSTSLLQPVTKSVTNLTTDVTNGVTSLLP